MELAKNAIDIGVQTNQRDKMMSFWGDTIGLPYDELLKVGGGTHQHRYGLNGSVFKMNHVRDPLPDNGKTGFGCLLIARPDLSDPVNLQDPDGNRVQLVPRGYRGITGIGFELNVSSLERFQAFYRDVLEIDQIDETSFTWGSTRFLLKETPQRQPCRAMAGLGYRYITVQVWEVDKEHAAFLGRGGTEGMPPRTLGTTARISFILDPDRNWIEVSQRASLTGALPDA